MRDKNVYELAVKKKVEGAFKWVRAAVIAGYVLLTLAIIIVANITKIGAVFIVIVPMILLFIVIPATWRFVEIEYYYRIGLDNNTNKKLTMDYIQKVTFWVERVQGKKNRVAQSGKRAVDISRTVVYTDVPVSDLELVAPYKDDYKKQLDEDKSIKRRYWALPSLQSPNAYYAVYKNGKDEKCAVIFEGTNEAIKMLSTYNKEKVVVTELSY